MIFYQKSKHFYAIFSSVNTCILLAQAFEYNLEQEARCIGLYVNSDKT